MKELPLSWATQSPHGTVTTGREVVWFRLTKQHACKDNTGGPCYRKLVILTGSDHACKMLCLILLHA